VQHTEEALTVWREAIRALEAAGRGLVQEPGFNEAEEEYAEAARAEDRARSRYYDEVALAAGERSTDRDV
jgi:hypothetical protein